MPEARAAEVRELVRRVLAAPPGGAPGLATAPPAAAMPAPALKAVAPAPARERPTKWRVVLPPASTPAGLRKAMRGAGMVCAAAGRWHGALTPAQRQELDPLVREAKGSWEKG